MGRAYMAIENVIPVLMSVVFLMASLPGELMASDAAMRLPTVEKGTSSNPGYIFIKSREEIAYELFIVALENMGELKFISTYEEYLEAYRKACWKVQGIVGGGEDPRGESASL